MGEGLLYSNSSGELIYYGECLLYDTGFVTRVTRWVPLVEHTHVHMHTHMLKSCPEEIKSGCRGWPIPPLFLYNVHRLFNLFPS